jgi:uncharacterized protein (TIGR02147 family)
MTLKGQANLSTRSAGRLCDALKLGKRAAQYFHAMVKFNQSRAHSQKLMYFESMARFSASSIHLVSENQYKFYDKWYHAAIRVLCDFFPVKENYREVARMLVPAITESEARKSIALLAGMNMIRPDGNGYYRPTEKLISTGWDIRSLAINNFVLKSTALALDAFERFDPYECNLSMLTIGISSQGFGAIENEVRQFRRRILEIVRYDKAERIYQLGIQLFPVSISQKKNGGSV